MSFSRWSNSRWYTYWAENSKKPGSNKRIDQIFEICSNTQFTYSELKENIDKCLEIVSFNETKVFDNNIGFELDPNDSDSYTIDQSLTPSKEEMEELRGYMLKFLSRVDNDPNLEN